MAYKLIWEPDYCAGCGEELKKGQTIMMAVKSKTGVFGTCHYPNCLEGYNECEGIQ